METTRHISAIPLNIFNCKVKSQHSHVRLVGAVNWLWALVLSRAGFNIRAFANVCPNTFLLFIQGGLIRLWLYKENNKLRDWKNVFTYSHLSSTYLSFRCSNFFNPSKKNSFGCAANRKIGNRKSQRLISTLTYILLYMRWVTAPFAECVFGEWEPWGFSQKVCLRN
jgi:hypothetical protein